MTADFFQDFVAKFESKEMVFRHGWGSLGPQIGIFDGVE